jgi:hypothetical protein
LSCRTLQQLIAQINRFRKKIRYSRHNLLGDRGGVGVAGTRPHVAKGPPAGPVAPQKALLIGGTDQVLEDHLIECLGRRGNPPQISAQHAVAELAGEFEPLDQPVTQLVFPRLALMAFQPLLQPCNRPDQRGDIEQSARRWIIWWVGG